MRLLAGLYLFCLLLASQSGAGTSNRSFDFAGISRALTGQQHQLLVQKVGAKGERLLFSDGFENVQNFSDLLPGNASRWTNVQRTHDDNKVEMETRVVRGGSRALHLYSKPARNVSKADIERGGLDLREGQRVTISAWFYIPGNHSLRELYLMDMECESCWPENSRRKNKSPGVRLALKSDAGILAVERGKIGFRKGTLRGAQVGFPRNRWVHLKWISVLSTQEDGLSEVYMDGQKILSARAINMPSPAIFKKYGIRLKQPIRYDRVQFGITANGTSAPVRMYLDDVRITTD